MWNCKVFVRIVEVLLCVACVITLRVTDDESRRVFHYLRNRSREWSLLNNVTWGTIGAALATVTSGGYVIVTMGLLVAAATGELRGRKTEFVLLGLGVVLFGIVGALSLASIESVPEDLIDNAAVLGALCLLTALVFIVDLLVKPPGTKKKHDGTTQTFVNKEFGKSAAITIKTEEVGNQRSNERSSRDLEKESGVVNDNYMKSNVSLDDRDHIGNFEGNELPDRDQKGPHPRSTDIFEEERNRKFEDVEKQLREYTRNLDNERSFRESQRRRELNETLKNEARRDFFENGRYRLAENGTRGIFQNEGVYSHPADETDTPPFPTKLETKSDAIFSKIVNPGVKIMRVERDREDKFDDYSHRLSDYSQYDNVPTRMRGPSVGILKKNRDSTFGTSSNSQTYKTVDGTRDEIEVLEGCFDALRTSTGTQTGSRTDRLQTPSSPTDPGYVRHTADNWPGDLKSKNSGLNLENGMHQ